MLSFYVKVLVSIMVKTTYAVLQAILFLSWAELAVSQLFNIGFEKLSILFLCNGFCKNDPANNEDSGNDGNNNLFHGKFVYKDDDNDYSGLMEGEFNLKEQHT